MKIAHVITRLILGGAQENTLLTCEGLHNNGHDVTLITGPPLGPEGELITRARAGGYRVIELDAMRRAIHPWRDWRSAVQLRRLFRHERFEVIHTHSSKAGIIGRSAAARADVPTVVHTIHGLPFGPHESWLKNRLYIALERRAARHSDAIISVCDTMTRKALAAGVGSGDQYTTIYSGMEVERFMDRPADTDRFRASLNLPADAVLVTQVSRLAELKGHDYILDAAEQIADSRIIFCFVGDGERRGWIEQQIARRGLVDRFRLTGLLPPGQIPAVMHASDILVHCSLREGLARTLPQAMLAGIPVVSFDIDGAAEVISDDTGVLLKAGDVDGLAAAIDQLADDPDRRGALGQAGRDLCRTRFDHRRMVDQIQGVYQQAT